MFDCMDILIQSKHIIILHKAIVTPLLSFDGMYKLRISAMTTEYFSNNQCELD